MGDVFAADVGKEDVASLKQHRFFYASIAIEHCNSAIENCKDLLAVVDVPLVRLICPVHAGCDAVHAGDVNCVPCARGDKFTASNDFHGCLKRLNKSTWAIFQ